MNSSGISAKPALELISLAKMAPEVARKNLRSMLIANPDYFGRITSNSFKAVLRIQQDTTYESIGYVAYSPIYEQLQATIHMNQRKGYSGAYCKSKEYVRFFLSLNGGSSWHDQGMGSIDVCDMPGPKPLQRKLSLGLSPVTTLCIADRLLPVVRTILSWNTPPPADMPEWIPLWGDVLDAQIRFEGMDGVELNPGLDNIVSPNADYSTLGSVMQKN